MTRVKNFTVRLFLFLGKCWNISCKYCRSRQILIKDCLQCQRVPQRGTMGLRHKCAWMTRPWRRNWTQLLKHDVWHMERKKRSIINKLDIARESWNSRKDELCGCHWTSLLSCRRQPWSGKRWTWRQLLTMKWQSCGKKLRTFGIRWNCRLKRYWLFSVAKS